MPTKAAVEAMLMMAPPLPRCTMRGHRLGGAEEEAGEMRPMTACHSSKGSLPISPTRWMPALIDQDVRGLALAVDGGEGGLDALGVETSVSEIAHAGRRLRLDLVERETTAAPPRASPARWHPRSPPPPVTTRCGL
jgi:hypothetical protein